MRASFKQAKRLVKLKTPLGTDDLLCDSLQGHEGLSEMFSFTLQMRSGRTDLSATRIVGQPVHLSLQVDGGPLRHLDGICRRFSHSGYDRDWATYEMQLVPRLWLLHLSRGRRIFQGKSVATIIKTVLSEASVGLSDKLSQTYQPLDYCVQYDESAFDFISRLMEQAGIFYFFSFSASGHTLVLADSSSVFTDCPDASTVRFSGAVNLARSIEVVTQFTHENTLALKKATVRDFDFEKPSTDLTGSHSASSGQGEYYEFASGHLTHQAGDQLARFRVEASQVQAQILGGSSLAYPFAAGTRFSLQGHFVPSLNTRYVLRRVHHEVRDDQYANRFEAFVAQVPFRPPQLTPLPRATGCETAIVVGPSGEEIWTDKFARIKLQFPWDRDGKRDEKSSPWIRVAQSLAGPGFGALVLPRVGQEVVVSYLQGDPQRPLVTGCVYNGQNTLPVKLPDHQTQTVLRTRSSKKGQAGNELRFEDKKDAEEVYLHAQKDLRIEIENALTTTIRKGAQTHTLEEGDSLFEIKKGNQSQKVKGTRHLEITGAETHANQASFKHTVAGDYELKIDGKLTITATGGLIIKSGTQGVLEAGTTLLLKSGTDWTGQAGTNLTYKAGMKMMGQAGVQLDLKAPVINSKADATQNVQAGAMLTLKGAMTKVN